MSKRANSTAHAMSIDYGTIAKLGAPSVSMIVSGHVPSLKNSRPIRRNRKTGKPFSARSDEAQRYIDDFCLRVPFEYRNLGLGGRKALLRSIVTVFYSSWRSDVDLAIIYDCLQHAGIVTNDRWIREKHEYAEVDAKNPRVEIDIEEI